MSIWAFAIVSVRVKNLNELVLNQFLHFFRVRTALRADVKSFSVCRVALQNRQNPWPRGKPRWVCDCVCVDRYVCVCVLINPSMSLSLKLTIESVEIDGFFIRFYLIDFFAKMWYRQGKHLGVLSNYRITSVLVRSGKRTHVSILSI